MQDPPLGAHFCVSRADLRRKHVSAADTGEVSDQGTYLCQVFTTATEAKKLVHLRVEGPVRSLQMEFKGDVLTCSSENIYLVPRVTWTPDSSHQTPLQLQQNQLFSISSSLTLKLRPPQRFTCNISTEHSWKSATYSFNCESAPVSCNSNQTDAWGVTEKVTEYSTELSGTGVSVYQEMFLRASECKHWSQGTAGGLDDDWRSRQDRTGSLTTRTWRTARNHRELDGNLEWFCMDSVDDVQSVGTDQDKGLMTLYMRHHQSQSCTSTGAPRKSGGKVMSSSSADVSDVSLSCSSSSSARVKSLKWTFNSLETILTQTGADVSYQRHLEAVCGASVRVSNTSTSAGLNWDKNQVSLDQVSLDQVWTRLPDDSRKASSLERRLQEALGPLSEDESQKVQAYLQDQSLMGEFQILHSKDVEKDGLIKSLLHVYGENSFTVTQRLLEHLQRNKEAEGKDTLWNLASETRPSV
ncbi:hypothetical protein WMY93_032538 [Mugilogobius chulae]|uniref:Ig-like domain-containing protein n=1 Tax=Mugilogobius chulae TaxID=88201 RepID=A0AAW0MWG7_9GOBI